MLGALTPKGRAAVRAHGIRTVIDLRTADEIAETASPFRDGLAYRHAPFTAARTMGLHRAAVDGAMADELRRLAAPDGGLAAAVAAIAESEPGIVIHCLAGRDRTGIVIAIVLAAIGVPDDEIVADYVASDVELADDYVRFKLANPDKVEAIDAAIERRAWTMGEVLSTLRLAFGGASAYLASAGASAAQVDAIRAKLVA
jgi:protein-tyrosine phosphatase